jgi:hypothetical protein
VCVSFSFFLVWEETHTHVPNLLFVLQIERNREKENIRKCVCVCVCIDCVFEKSVGFATILLLFLLSQILPFVYFVNLLVVVVPNSPLRVLLHLLLFLLFQIHHFV